MTTARERAEKAADAIADVAVNERYNFAMFTYTKVAALKVITAAIEAAEQAAREAEREACARIAEKAFGGPAHTYASENADLYRAQDGACELIASLIRARTTPTETPT